MKKFKQFYIKPTSEAMNKACVNHGKELGYSFHGICDYYGVIEFHDSGEFLTHTTSLTSNKLSIDDFFKLTKEDVIVESERFTIRLTEYGVKTSYGDIVSTSELCDLTREQINRIKEIKNEGNHE